MSFNFPLRDRRAFIVGALSTRDAEFYLYYIFLEVEL
jgi:hypothetical protein